MARLVDRRSSGRRPAPDPAAIAERRMRAAEEALDVRWRGGRPFPDLEVRNPIHRTSYRVLFPEYPGRDAAFCTCTDFAKRGLGTCKHVEAAWDWLRSAAPAPVPPAVGDARPAERWEEIDRRLAELASSPEPGIRQVGLAGAVLYEPPPVPKRAGEVAEKVGRSKAPGRGSTPTSRGRP